MLAELTTTVNVNGKRCLLAKPFTDVLGGYGNLLVQAYFVPDFLDVQLADEYGQVLPEDMEAKTAFCHFLNGLLFAPALDDDTIGSTHCAGAIRAVLTMYKNRCSIGVCDNSQKPNDIIVTYAPCRHTDMHVRQICAFQLVSV